MNPRSHDACTIDPDLELDDCEHKFVSMLEGNTIDGRKLFVYACGRCNKLDYILKKG